MRSLLLVTITTLAIGATGCASRGGTTSQVRMAPTPAATPWTESLRGSHASPAIGAFVRERHAQLQVCYDDVRAARAPNGALVGKATIGVLLADDGRVTGATITERTWQGEGGADVERCLLSTVRRWRFPEAERSAQHAHTFSVVFSS